MACSRRHASVSLMACSSPVAIARSVSRSGVSLAGAVAAEGKDPAKAAKIPAAACQAYRTAPGASLAGRCGKSQAHRCGTGDGVDESDDVAAAGGSEDDPCEGR